MFTYTLHYTADETGVAGTPVEWTEYFRRMGFDVTVVEINPAMDHYEILIVAGNNNDLARLIDDWYIGERDAAWRSMPGWAIKDDMELVTREIASISSVPLSVHLRYLKRQLGGHWTWNQLRAACSEMMGQPVKWKDGSTKSRSLHYARKILRLTHSTPAGVLAAMDEYSLDR